MSDYSTFRSVLLLKKITNNSHNLQALNARKPLIVALFLISLTSVSYSLSLFFPIFTIVFCFSIITCFLGGVVFWGMVILIDPDDCHIYFSDTQFYKQIRKTLGLDQYEFNIVFEALTFSDLNPKQTFPELGELNDAIEKTINHQWQSISNPKSIQNIVEGLRSDEKLFFDNEENRQLFKLVNLYNHQIDKVSRNKQQLNYHLEKAGINIPDDKHLPTKNQKIKITE